MNAHSCRPGADLPTRDVVQWLRETGLDEDEILIGLVQASVRGWIVALNSGTIRLTDEGLAAGAEHGSN
jgi:hypothetical protein